MNRVCYLSWQQPFLLLATMMVGNGMDADGGKSGLFHLLHIFHYELQVNISTIIPH